jgi:nucleoside-diphosphate-sugar epimerase
MKVGLVGSRGMLGRALDYELTSRGMSTFYIFRETNYHDLPKLDLLINAGGNSKKYVAESNPIKDFQDNVETLFRLLNSPSLKNTLVVHISSSEVYGNLNSSNSITDESFLLNPSSNYGFSKMIAEKIVEKYSENYLIFRLGGLFGKGMTKGPIFDIVNNLPLRLTGDSTLQLLNTAEAAKKIIDVIGLSNMNEIYNLASPDVLTIFEIGKLLERVLKFSSDSLLYNSHLSVEKISKLVPLASQSAQLSGFKNEYRLNQQ